MRRMFMIGTFSTAALTLGAFLPSTAVSAGDTGSSAAPEVRRIDCLESGGYVTVVTPASGFNPLTATDDELEANGFSPRPDRADASYAEWAKYATGPIRRIDKCPDPTQSRGIASQNFMPVDKDGKSVPLAPAARPRYLASPKGAVEVPAASDSSSTGRGLTRSPRL